MDEQTAHSQPGLDSALTAPLVLGAISFLLSGAIAYGGLMDMREGSDAEALVSLWFAAPLIVLTVAVFIVSALRGASDAPRRKRSRLFGLLLALAAFPFWLTISGAIAQLMHWG